MKAQVTIDGVPFACEGGIWGDGRWPVRWIECPGVVEVPAVTAFRLPFEVTEDTVCRVHLTANERYKIYLDGEFFGCGSERGDNRNWFFESYHLELKAGRHMLTAIVWALGDESPYAQIPLGAPSFLLACEGPLASLLGTGRGPWEAKLLRGYQFTGSGVAWGTGSNISCGGPEFDWAAAGGGGAGWSPVKDGDGAYSGGTEYGFYALNLQPATLPPMLQQLCRAGIARHASLPGDGDPAAFPIDERDNLPELAADWNALLRQERPLRVEAGRRQRLLIDLQNYFCAYPLLTVSGGKGASIRIHWAESLFESSEGGAKGNRDAVEGKFFRGVGDIFRPDGGAERSFETLWWQAGRYLEVLVETAGEPLSIQSFQLRETRYPLEMESSFRFSDTRLEMTIPILMRALQMCSHETYMDCPYYEQMMYAGDTRLEILSTYAVSGDDRLPAKALRLFDASRLFEGLTASRTPSRVTQVIPGFSLWWIAMLHDHARWRGNAALIRRCLPGARAVIDAFAAQLTDEGLVRAPEGWHFMDWVPQWNQRPGIPPAGSRGVCGILNWQFVMVLRLAAELEDWLGEAEPAARDRRLAKEVAAAAHAAFWDEERGLFADDTARKNWSEHAQCLAVLSGALSRQEELQLVDSMLAAPDLARTTIYFTHYLFEALAVTGRMEALFERLGLWFSLADNGFKTTFEMPGNSRSDCHAWGAHPLYHYYATILGLRPAAFDFAAVEIRPQLGPLTMAAGSLVHPQGMIDIELQRQEGEILGSCSLPEGIGGDLICREGRIPLQPGKNRLRFLEA